MATSELQGRTVLVLPIGKVHKDIGAVYHAVMQNYRAINGYSGYEPPYYEALRTLLDAGDGRLFGPFVSRGDVDVLVSWREMGLRALIEQQPGSQLVSEGQIFHYRVPSRDVPPVRTQPAGVRVPVSDVQSACSREVGFITDADLGTRWVCGIKAPDQSLTVDLGAPAPVGTIVHALGPAGGEFPRHLVIETSVDGAAWTMAWEGSPAVAVLHAAMAAPRESRAVIEFPSRTARYRAAETACPRGHLCVVACGARSVEWGSLMPYWEDVSTPKNATDRQSAPTQRGDRRACRPRQDHAG